MLHMNPIDKRKHNAESRTRRKGLFILTAYSYCLTKILIDARPGDVVSACQRTQYVCFVFHIHFAFRKFKYLERSGLFGTNKANLSLPQETVSHTCLGSCTVPTKET